MLIKPKIILSIVLLVLIPSISNADDLSDLFQRVNPAVVVLHTFEHPANIRTNKKTPIDIEGLGSGVLISKDGKVLTAAHVVNLAESVHIEFSNGEKTLGHVVASDPVTDVALIQLNVVPKGVKIAILGNSDETKIGEQVFVIGTPYGYEHTLTVGYISARRAPAGLLSSELFQTDAAINQGNSGGPMFNMKGEVIGIVSSIQSRSGGFEGLGFAVTMKTVKDIVLDNKGFWNGVQSVLLTKKFAQLLNVPNAYGLIIERVAETSPAGLAGLQGGTMKATIEGHDFILGGDIIVMIDDISLDGPQNLANIRQHIRNKMTKKTAQNIAVEIYRGGKFRKISIELSK